MSTETNIGKNMILVTGSFRQQPTFNLIPASLDCPYVECLFDPQSKILAVITKTMKGSYHMVPRIDDNGDAQRVKVGRRENGKTVKEQRVLVDTFSEFYLAEEKEITDFIKAFAINASTYKWKDFLKAEPVQPKSMLHLPTDEKDMIKQPLITKV
tara:strand:+ start:1855 stop:2319 length:465 start_codon:yes stop_codon:yes gene_type:complete